MKTDDRDTILDEGHWDRDFCKPSTNDGLLKEIGTQTTSAPSRILFKRRIHVTLLHI